MKKGLDHGMFLMALLILVAGCSLDTDDDTRYIKGEGPLVTHIIQTDTFTSIHHGSFGSLNIIRDDSFAISLRAQQNVIDEMVFFEENEVFFWGINGDVRVTESDSIELNIHMPVEIGNVLLTGVGNIKITGPSQEEVVFEMQGIGNILSYGMEVDHAQTFLSGSGNIQVKVNEKISGILSGSGNIFYKGDPLVQVLVTGAGNVMPDN